MLIGGLLICGSSLSAAAADPLNRLERQVRIFEKALDTMLIDSPNFLVDSREPTQGYYVEDHGAVFTFRTSLVHKRDRGFFWCKDKDKDKQDREEMRAKEIQHQSELYADGKEELITTILAFGEVMTRLPDGEMLDVRIRLRDALYFKENDMRRLRLTAEMNDLRSYYDGRLSEERMIERIKIEEG
ncbi:MAG: hypothetical protein GF355_13075 [Candidatus Eisenbacteria bacterium]|nr:hypothetical protein [Candidatus Eisenbacteria bacterium]